MCSETLNTVAACIYSVISIYWILYVIVLRIQISLDDHYCCYHEYCDHFAAGGMPSLVHLLGDDADSHQLVRGVH